MPILRGADRRRDWVESATNLVFTTLALDARPWAVGGVSAGVLEHYAELLAITLRLTDHAWAAAELSLAGPEGVSFEALDMPPRFEACTLHALLPGIEPDPEAPAPWGDPSEDFAVEAMLYRRAREVVHEAIQLLVDCARTDRGENEDGPFNVLCQHRRVMTARPLVALA